MIEEVRTMCAQHDALREVASLYRQELSRETPNLVALSQCRWRLMRLVAVHLSYEDRHLYAALAHCGPRITELGERMASELGHLNGSLQNHVREWTSMRVADDWPGYRAASLALVTVLQTRMDREEKELYPMVLMAKVA